MRFCQDLCFCLSQQSANAGRGLGSNRKPFGSSAGIRRAVLYALRAMRQNSAFTPAAVLTLTLGIGGDTAMFTVIRSALLKPHWCLV
jgi:hypothetical protein